MLNKFTIIIILLIISFPLTTFAAPLPIEFAIYPDYPAGQRHFLGVFQDGIVRFSSTRGATIGFMDAYGRVVIPERPGTTNPFSEGRASVGDYGQMGFIDMQGNVAIPLIYQRVIAFNGGLAAVQKNDRWGFIDIDGNVVIPLIYEQVYLFSEGFAAVSNAYGRWGFVDRQGNEVVPLIYQQVFAFMEGIAIVKNNDKFGAVDMTGRVVIPIENDWVSGFGEDGIAAVIGDVSVDGSGFFINTSGVKVITDARFVHGVVGVDTSRVTLATWGVLDRFIGDFAPVIVWLGESLNEVRNRSELPARIAFMNRLGEIVYVTDIEYNSSIGATGFIDEILYIYIGQEIALFNMQDGKLVYMGRFEGVRPFYEGLAAVRRDDKWGFIDTSGNITIPITFQNAFDFSEGLASVSIDYMWGFIDRSGNVAVPLEFNFVSSFSEGLAFVMVFDSEIFDLPENPYLDLFHAFIKNPLRNLIRVNIDGSYITFDQNPTIEDGRTLVPMRAIFEALDAYVYWEAASQTITVTRGADTIVMSIGVSEMLLNGHTISLDVAPSIRDGRTLIPVRAIAEALDADVVWDSENNTVVIRR